MRTLIFSVCTKNWTVNLKNLMECNPTDLLLVLAFGSYYSNCVPQKEPRKANVVKKMFSTRNAINKKDSTMNYEFEEF